MRNARGHQGENEQQWKKKRKEHSDIYSIKRVIRKFLEVSRCSHAKQRHRNVQKNVLHVQIEYEQLVFYIRITRTRIDPTKSPSNSNYVPFPFDMTPPFSHFYSVTSNSNLNFTENHFSRRDIETCTRNFRLCFSSNMFKCSKWV